MTTPDTQALEDALSAEYAAVYAYGVVAAYANPDRLKLVAEYTAAHRARRDATIELMERLNISVPAPDAAYTVPFEVNDPIPAAKLAVTVESDCAVAWCAAVEHAGGADVRAYAVGALTDSALRLATWQSILGTNPATTAFPGRS
ncbi:ferritin-like domain-containing protein [Nocardia sp. 2]|uniref:Ferritin-like domain-containing protein n=1 Tax=Nocardia acididurans TaxID=2802282 RepID=A0ABS1MDL3_9NOCA|nr:ferritin-like domain-containing protein [Nocardia acididurans]MBL1078732.1 ferritin-like domain-containing protein [Nocardia acididurans]